MPTPAPSQPGLLEALRGFGDAAVGTLHDRLQLVSTELREEKLRLIQMFIWISAGFLAGLMTVAFGSLTLVYSLPKDTRLAALGGLTLFSGTCLAVTAAIIRRFLARQPKPFAASLAEIREDRECIRPKN